MKTTDNDRDAVSAQRTRDVERAWKLVRLHPNQRNKAKSVVVRKQGANLSNTDARISFVDHGAIKVNVWAEHGAMSGVARKAVNDSERVRRDERPRPLNDVAVVVIMRRLD